MKKVRCRRLTPQEKKFQSYTKDRRNSYGEAGARSRFSITRNKINERQRLRHEQKMVLKQTVKASKDELEIVEIAVKAVKPRRWRKCPDRQLGQQVAGKVLDKEELGMKEKLKRYRIMSQAKRKWRKMFRYDRWD